MIGAIFAYECAEVAARPKRPGFEPRATVKVESYLATVRGRVFSRNDLATAWPIYASSGRSSRGSALSVFNFLCVGAVVTTAVARFYWDGQHLATLRVISLGLANCFVSERFSLLGTLCAFNYALCLNFKSLNLFISFNLYSFTVLSTCK